MKLLSTVILLVGAISLSACQAGPTDSPASVTGIESPTLPSVTAQPATAAVAQLPSVSHARIADLETVVGYSVREPVVPDGYILENVTVDKPTHSVCLHYRHSASEYDVLFLAQGPTERVPALEVIPGWPEYSVLSETVQIGGAENSFHLVGWRRSGWACTGVAERANTPYSFSVAPSLAWEADRRQYDLYALNGGCGTPGGMTMLELLRVAEGLTGVSTHSVDELDPQCLHSVADVETLAGIDVKEPAYLPEGVLLYFATYQALPTPLVSLHFKIIHPEYGDKGAFFEITQELQDTAPVDVPTCGQPPRAGCELLQVDTLPILYYREPGRVDEAVPEELDWYVDGFHFRLWRHAGEPGKIYKEELVKVVDSME